MKTVYIYALLDPITDEVCYVGRTANIKRRKYQHLRSGLTSKYCLEVDIWSCRICDMEQVNHRILEECKESNMKERELYWIRRMWKEGHPLLNMNGFTDLERKGIGFQERIKSTKWYAEYLSNLNSKKGNERK